MPLPHGFVVTLDRHTRVLDEGRALLGGFPTRLIRLTPRARPLLYDRTLRVTNRASALLADRLLECGMAVPAVERLPLCPDPRWTVVVPVRDRARPLDRLLTALGTHHPVVVVDDASRHPGQVAAVAAKHGARLVELPANLGPAGARNAGLRLVTTPYVVFADSDVVVDPDTITTLLRHFADPRVAMAVPRITGLPGTAARGWIGRYEEVRSSLDLGRHPAAVCPGTPVSWASTACVVARVDALRDGFDESLRVGEDVDLCWRLAENGRRVRYEPSVEAAHEHRVRLGDWFTRKVAYGTGADPLARRHPEFIAPAVLAPWNTALVVALLAQRRWSLPAAGAAFGVATVTIARKLDGTGHPYRLALRLTANGAVSALSQTSALLTRHWWPLAALGCAVSSRVRRATAVAALTDIALEYRKDEAALDPVRYGVARRLDDIAYGTGVWFSALRGRSTKALRPRLVRRGVSTGRTRP
ncbi:mycofactocin biosynthesis glycosyltransferase MftF [Streptomyces sp. SID13726]|uniref:mycofactocin biosynthesis glycosyltransferase MftF n=1 Tax=Streptomyces sp. SID13726 TaxID=2706058 RepID=UPI0013B5D77F|nr:mycofactocin biosynthesis glycosyltransferase MftF [Streptomyces sp. SID13726]NEB00908.1 mycofactocin system glycosyltransferase [Streptomyces sp. SID13726]